MVRAGTSTHYIEVYTFQIVFDADVGGGDIADHFGDKEGADSTGSGSVAFDAFFFESKDAPDTRSGNHSGTIGIEISGLQAGIFNRLTGSNHCKLRVHIQLSYFFMIKMVLGIVVLYFCGDPYREIICIKTGYHANSNHSTHKAFPSLGDIVPNRSDGTDSGDYDSSSLHINLCLVFLKPVFRL